MPERAVTRGGELRYFSPMAFASARGGPGIVDPHPRFAGAAGAREAVKILVVDDREDNLLATESVLRNPEYELVLARSGHEALRFLLHGECALILLDVQMPELDGFETARLVRGNERTRAIPIVFMTAISREERFIAKGYETGAVDYLLKPIDPDVLRSKVAAFVELYRAKQEIVRQAALLREADRAERQRVVERLELRNLRRQQAASERYRQLMEGIRHAIVWTIDPHTLACTFVSPSTESLLGVPALAWTATAWSDRVPAEERDALVAALRSVSNGGAATVEHGLVAVDGRVARFRTELQAFPAEDERGPEIRGFSVDVTEARAGEAALAFLARAGADVSRSLEVAPTVERAAAAAIPFLADACAFTISAPREGEPVVAVAHADPTQEPVARALARHPGLERLADGTPSVAELELLRDGAKGPPDRWTALSVPLRLHERGLGTARFFRLARSFSAQDARLAEEFATRAGQAIENALLYGDARETVRLREDFISVASHELRTPLTPLALQTRALQRVVSAELSPGPLREALLDRVASCARQVDRMTRFVTNLLDVTRLRSNRLDLQLEPFDLRDLVLDVTARFQEEIARWDRHIELSAPQPLVGRWDRTKIDQVLTNLLTNAIRYGANGPIDVTAARSGGNVVLSVRDRGDGIAPEDVPRIFERFERGALAGAKGGLGLGLYIVRRIVEAHGGRIHVESAPGAGSTFTVELPAQAPADAAMEPAGPAEPAAH
jgi:signal transduction histidine kinase/DNA-binding response OmpR family regulator